MNNNPDDDGHETKQSSKSKVSSVLRLYNSDLLTAWMALQYLYQVDQVGKHYYLCNRLRDLPLQDIDSIIPQLCHLMVIREDSSTPLECFMMEKCRKSVHISSQLLWLLESYIYDCNRQKDTDSQAILKRVNRLLKEVQRASFARDSLKCNEFGNRRRRSFMDELDVPYRYGIDDLPSVYGTLFGFGISLMSISIPEAAASLKPLALLEARTPHYSEISAVMFPKDCRPTLPGTSVERKYLSPPMKNCLPTPFNASSPSLEELHKGNAFSTFASIIERTAKQIESKITKNVKADSFPLMYHAEMQFVVSLIEISKRICLVSTKDARQKALHAELDIINHNLPAKICLPFLCGSSQSGYHHRIVRIPANESTILNSAERVPYLVYIEVIEGASDEYFATTVSVNKSDESSILNSSVSLNVEEQVILENSDEIDLIEARTPVILNEDMGIEGKMAERMRTAAIMLAQLNRQASVPGVSLKEIDTIRNKLIVEIESIEKERMYDDLSGHKHKLFPDDVVLKVDASKRPLVIRDDPSAAVFREDFNLKRERIRQSSPFGTFDGWNLLSVIVKSGADMRQEHLACQLLKEIQSIWDMEEVECWTSPHHNVLIASPEGGLIEAIPDTLSIHSIRKAALTKNSSTIITLKEYFKACFGDETSEEYNIALVNFIQSFAGYSLISYILQLKDRHNGNILIEKNGHVVHIDFGFMLSNTPGGNYGFETAPFKFSADFIDMLNGSASSIEFKLFKSLMLSGFLAVRKHHERLQTIISASIQKSSLPCFINRELVIPQFKARLCLNMTEKQVEMQIDRLITSSAYNMFTKLYDSYQYYSNGIL